MLAFRQQLTAAALMARCSTTEAQLHYLVLDIPFGCTESPCYAVQLVSCGLICLLVRLGLAPNLYLSDLAVLAASE